MGINNLLPLLRQRGLLRPMVAWPPGSIVAVDVPIFAHKFVYSERTIEGLHRRFVSFAHELKHICVPIFVFDGQKLKLKDKERQKRHEERDKQLERLRRKASLVPTWSNETFEGLLWPTAQDYTKLEHLLQEAGFQTRRAKYEAEALCAHLTHTESAYAVLTEDSDALAFGAKRVIFKYFKGPEEALLEDILTHFQFTQEKWIDFCCLLGNDFCENVHDIGPKRALDLMQRFPRWTDAMENDVQQMKWSSKTKESARTFQIVYPDVYHCFESCAYERIPEKDASMDFETLIDLEPLNVIP